MKKIQVGDFRLVRKEKKVINEVLGSGRFSEGMRVREFEQKWAEFVGTKYCVATSSGAGALITGLTALKYKYDLPRGTKVITTPLTYIADSSAISMVGFEPVYVDVDPETFGITPETIEAHLKQTKDLNNYAIILPVDLMGFPVEIEKINKLAEKYKLLVFEDAAQAHGTVYKGHKTGSQTFLSVFSFYVAHNIQAGEMGALVTNDPEIFRLARKIKAQGRACECFVCTRAKGKCPLIENYRGKEDYDPRFAHDLIGYNFKTMEFQAALALTQLKKVDWIIKKRQENVKFLNEHLKQYSDILQLPSFSNEISYLAYPLVVKRPDIISRKELRKKLEDLYVETRPLFGCIPTQQPAYAYIREQYERKLPNAEYLGLNAFYIGCHQYLTKGDLVSIVEAFYKILKGAL
jgi:dTDP-4-amino-4,6-dideoxygalactose transaminase